MYTRWLLHNPVRLFVWLWLLVTPPSQAESLIRVTDDTGQELVLQQPVQRVVSLAPYITELLFAAGAGNTLVGVSEFSDYPGAAQGLPRVASGHSLDLEAIVALRPEVVITWKSGNPDNQIEQLRRMGLQVFVSEPRRLRDIMSSLERFGLMTGQVAAAEHAVRRFRRRHAELLRRYGGQAEITVFYQVWEQPLMTVNGRHLISDVIRLCGGRNVFAELPGLAPQIDIEAVLQRDPEVIVAGVDAGESLRPLQHWRRWPELRAVNNGHLFTVHRDLLVRHSPRILDGAEQLCRQLDEVRAAGR